MTPSAADLRDRLEHGPLVLDGAAGTELERRGVQTRLPLWSAAALTEHPEVVAAIHTDYAAAGADILVANTFRTNPRTLRRAGRLADGPLLNRTAVGLARQAAGTRPNPPLVAASVAPVEDCYRPDLVPDEAVLRDEHSEMMTWLHAAGPDLIWIETMNTIREARAAAAAAAATGLPFVVSFVVQESGDLLSGERLEDAITTIGPADPLAVGLNCIPPSGLTAILPRLRRATTRPLAAYAHINNPRPIRGWSFAEALTPAEYARHVRVWLDLGVRIIGGCCGTTPDHIRAVRELCSRPP